MLAEPRNSAILTVSLVFTEILNMVLYIRVLKSLRVVKALLREDGWDMEDLGSGTFTATNNRVADETDARERLFSLGLLTSAWLRIDFEPHIPSGVAHGLSVHKPHSHTPRFLHKPIVSNRLKLRLVSGPNRA